MSDYKVREWPALATASRLWSRPTSYCTTSTSSSCPPPTCGPLITSGLRLLSFASVSVKVFSIPSRVPFVTIGSLRLENPEAWFLGCLLLWVVFVPLYLTATGRNPFARNNT